MKILDKDFEMKYNLRSMFLFEQITEKPFQVNTLMDEYILFYSCLVSVTTNPPLEFDEFIDYCNEHPEAFEEFGQFMDAENKKRELLKKKNQ